MMGGKRPTACTPEQLRRLIYADASPLLSLAIWRIKPNGRDCYNHESDTPNAMSWSSGAEKWQN